MTKSPFAVRPDFKPHKGFSQSAPLERPSDALFRALACYIKSGNFQTGEGVWKPQTIPVLDAIKSAYGEDDATRLVMAKLITKAAVIPADTTTSHWATDLVQTVIGDFIQSLIRSRFMAGSQCWVIVSRLLVMARWRCLHVIQPCQ